MSLAGTVLPLKFMIRLTGFRLVVLIYHTVSDREMPHLSELYRVRSTREFERDLDGLLRRFAPVSAMQVHEAITSGRNFTKPSLLMSFDDGFSESAGIIAPILKRRGVPAIFFLNPAFLDNRQLFYRCKCSLLAGRLRSMKDPKGLCELVSSRIPGKIGSARDLYRYLLALSHDDEALIDDLATLFEVDFQGYLKVRKPYLSTGQVRDLLSDGFEVGAHSLDHPEYSTLSNDEQMHQTVKSMDFICSTFGVPYRYFAFPFTDSGVGDHFFNRLYTLPERTPHLTFGTAGLKKDVFPRHLQRIPAEETVLPAMFRIRGEYLAYCLKRIISKHHVNRKA